MKVVFDIGGTKTRVAVSPDGVSLGDVLTFPTDQDFEKAMENINITIRKLAGKNKISVAGGGIAGVLDEGKTKLVRSPNLSNWEGNPLKKSLQEITQASVYINNDVAMGGLGEATMGAGRRSQIVAYLAVGTGIGGVKVADGKICPNAWGFEPGHQIIDVNGKVGYWEDFAGGSAMEKIFGKKPEEISDETIWDQETRLLAIGVHNVILLWSPEILIMGGGVMKKINISKLAEYVAFEMEMFPKLPEIIPGQLGEKSGLYGALEYLKSQNPGY
jgi:glucokinase